MPFREKHIIGVIGRHRDPTRRKKPSFLAASSCRRRDYVMRRRGSPKLPCLNWTAPLRAEPARLSHWNLWTCVHRVRSRKTPTKRKNRGCTWIDADPSCESWKVGKQYPQFTHSKSISKRLARSPRQDRPARNIRVYPRPSAVPSFPRRQARSPGTKVFRSRDLGYEAFPIEIELPNNFAISGFIWV